MHVPSNRLTIDVTREWRSQLPELYKYKAAGKIPSQGSAILSYRVGTFRQGVRTCSRLPCSHYDTCLQGFRCVETCHWRPGRVEPLVASIIMSEVSHAHREQHSCQVLRHIVIGHFFLSFFKPNRSGQR